jgi:hypothetical protein
MFRAGLLLVIKSYYSVYTAVGMSCDYVDWMLVGSEWNHSDPTNSQST